MHKRSFDREKNLAIEEEVRTAYALIKVGMVNLMKMKENAYHFHLPLFEISNGLERLLKSILLMDYFADKGSYPNDKRFFKKRLSDTLMSGHELKVLLNEVLKIYQNSSTLKLARNIESDHQYLTTHYLPTKLLGLLSEFATETRYRNLNVLLGANGKNYVSPENSVIKLIDEIKEREFSHLPPEEYRHFELSIREVFNSLVRIMRFLSTYFMYGGYYSEGMRHMNQAWIFLKYSSEPVLDLEKYKRKKRKRKAQPKK